MVEEEKFVIDIQLRESGGGRARTGVTKKELESLIARNVKREVDEKVRRQLENAVMENSEFLKSVVSDVREEVMSGKMDPVYEAALLRELRKQIITDLKAYKSPARQALPGKGTTTIKPKIVQDPNAKEILEGGGAPTIEAPWPAMTPAEYRKAMKQWESLSAWRKSREPLANLGLRPEPAVGGQTTGSPEDLIMKAAGYQPLRGKSKLPSEPARAKMIQNLMFGGGPMGIQRQAQQGELIEKLGRGVKPTGPILAPTGQIPLMNLVMMTAKRQGKRPEDVDLGWALGAFQKYESYQRRLRTRTQRLKSQGMWFLETMQENPARTAGKFILNSIKMTGPVGAALTGLFSTIISVHPVTISLVKNLGKKGGPWNQDWHRTISEEVTGMFTLEQQKRRDLGLHGYIVSSDVGYEPIDGTEVHNSLLHRDEIRLNKLSQGEKVRHYS